MLTKIIFFWLKNLEFPLYLSFIRQLKCFGFVLFYLSRCSQISDETSSDCVGYCIESPIPVHRFPPFNSFQYAVQTLFSLMRLYFKNCTFLRSKIDSLRLTWKYFSNSFIHAYSNVFSLTRLYFK